MKKRLAQLLRRVASKLDPSIVSRGIEQVTPLEFLESKELAMEIRRRNDLVVIFWGREAAAAEGYWKVEGECAWRIKHYQISKVISHINDNLRSSFSGGSQS